MSAILGTVARPWTWFFRKPPQTDYEEVLSNLQEDLDHVQSNLISIQTRKRRATIIFPLWASLFWALWTVAAYFMGLLRFSEPEGEQAIVVVWGPIILSPLVIFFTRRIVSWWYKRVQKAEEEHLKELRKQKSNKIEEIKRATKYDHLRNLLDKYDDQAQAKGPQGQKVGTPDKRQQQPQTPVRGQAAPQGPQAQSAQRPATQPAGQHQQQQQQQQLRQPQQPLPSGMRPQGLRPSTGPPTITLQRTWLDRVADAVLGSDPSGAALGPEQKYALICTQCKQHNGLATREEFDEIQYICPHCGTFNTRRPSSVPVSSPWRNSADVSSSRTPRPSSRLGDETRPTSSLRPSSRLMDDSDSPPPRTPLGGTADDEEEGDETREVELLGGKKETSDSTGTQLSQRKSAGGRGDTSQMDVD
ncbi:unnamed protein product [Sympodiomycopsis kandeliae]